MTDGSLLKFGPLNEIQFLLKVLRNGSDIVFADHSDSRCTLEFAFDFIVNSEYSDRIKEELCVDECGNMFVKKEKTPQYTSALESLRNHAQYFHEIANALENMAEQNKETVKETDDAVN